MLHLGCCWAPCCRPCKQNHIHCAQPHACAQAAGGDLTQALGAAGCLPWTMAPGWMWRTTRSACRCAWRLPRATCRWGSCCVPAAWSWSGPARRHGGEDGSCRGGSTARAAAPPTHVHAGAEAAVGGRGAGQPPVRCAAARQGANTPTLKGLRLSLCICMHPNPHAPACQNCP